MKHSTVRDAVRAAMEMHSDGDFWKNYLDEPAWTAHTRNALKADDYLDDMRHAERRRRNGFTPTDRARLDMPVPKLDD
jgi:hypothetical protein